jgi:hypothetical protein
MQPVVKENITYLITEGAEPAFIYGHADQNQTFSGLDLVAGSEGRDAQLVLQEGQLVSVRVNGKNEYGGVIEMVVDADRFEALIAKFTNESSKLKFCAFYVKKDPNATILLEEQRQEMLTLFPDCADGAIYVLDPSLSMREYAGLMEWLERNDLLESKCIEGTVLNGALLNRLPNLTTVTLRGIEASNLPENVTVIREEYTKYDLNQDRLKLVDTTAMGILSIE